MKKTLKSLSVFLLTLMSLQSVLFATDPQQQTNYGPFFIPPFIVPHYTFSDLITFLSSALFLIGLAIGVFFVIKAGYSFITSEGNPAKVKEAQEELTAAIAGILFILFAGVILNLIMKTFVG